jgi:hypothetical protein
VDNHRAQPRAPRTFVRRDISTLPTHQLHLNSAPQLQGADTYDREAALLQALAQQLERRLWECSEVLARARTRYEWLQEQELMKTARGTAPLPAQRHDLEQARLEVEGYVAVIFQLHWEYGTYLHQAEQYLAAATILHGGALQDRQDHK